MDKRNVVLLISVTCAVAMLQGCGEAPDAGPPHAAPVAQQTGAPGAAWGNATPAATGFSEAGQAWSPAGGHQPSQASGFNGMPVPASGIVQPEQPLQQTIAPTPAFTGPSQGYPAMEPDAADGSRAQRLQPEEPLGQAQREALYGHQGREREQQHEDMINRIRGAGAAQQ